MSDESETKQAASSLNTLLLGITIAVMGTVGAMSLNNAISLGRIEAGQVTRPEIEAKINEQRQETNRQQTEINTNRQRILELEFRMKGLSPDGK